MKQVTNQNPKTLRKEKIADFDEVTEPVIKWLNERCHPHNLIIIEPDGAVLLEGQAVVRTNKYIKE